VHEALSYSFTIIGAIIADSWLGHFKTIIWMELAYVVGAIIAAIANIEPLNLSVP